MIAMAPLDQVLLGQQRKQTATACKEDQSAAYSSQLISEWIQLVDRSYSLSCMLRVMVALVCYSVLTYFCDIGAPFWTRC